MSDSDSFIREVTEEVRQDRMLRYWKRYGPYVLGAIALIVAAAAAWSWQEQQARETARVQGGAFLSVASGDTAATARLVETIEGPASLVAQLRHAAALAAAGERSEAIAAYDRVAGIEGIDLAYSDLAALQAARLAAPVLDSEAALARVEPLISGAAPYRLLALELRAALLLNAGRTEAAHADLNAILADPERTGGLDARARALLAATGGRAEAPTN